MITIIANWVGEMTCRSKPMLSTTNSMRPRVFMRIRTAAESRHARPLHRAATEVPPNLPTEATRTIRAQIAHSGGPSLVERRG